MVWGRAKAEKLRAIKKQVDPCGFFNCYRCMGYRENHDVEKVCASDKSLEEEENKIRASQKHASGRTPSTLAVALLCAAALVLLAIAVVAWLLCRRSADAVEGGGNTTAEDDGTGDDTS